jgi:hypothetical protein
MGFNSAFKGLKVKIVRLFLLLLERLKNNRAIMTKLKALISTIPAADTIQSL